MAQAFHIWVQGVTFSFKSKKKVANEVLTRVKENLVSSRVKPLRVLAKTWGRIRRCRL